MHDPRQLKFFGLVYLYLMLGLITCNRVAGRESLFGESTGLIVVGNMILIPLAAVGFIRVTRSGRFMSFDKGMWLVCTVGCYSLGMFAIVCYQLRG